MGKFTAAFPALQYRNFRLFWSGQCISLIGTWMQNVGQAWLVLQLTGSPWLLGVVGAVQFAPALFLSMFAGVIVDRFPKRKILIFTQSVLMIQALIMTILIWLGVIRYWEVVLMAFVLGVITTLDHPTRQAFVSEIVDKDHLMNAIGLNSMIFNGARVIGPALAGVIMTLFGLAGAFLINTLSFVAVLINLFRISPSHLSNKVDGSDVISEIKEGLKFVRNNPTILSILILVAVVNVFAVNYNVTIPVFAQKDLGLQAGGYGLLLSALGVGAFGGALFLTWRGKKVPRINNVRIAAIALASGIIFISLQKSYLLTALLIAGCGFAMINVFTVSNTVLQLRIPDDLRGRVMSLYSFILMGLAPLGNLLAGAITDRFGVSTTFRVGGTIVICIVIVLMVRSKDRKLKGETG